MGLNHGMHGNPGVHELQLFSIPCELVFSIFVDNCLRTQESKIGDKVSILKLDHFVWLQHTKII